MEKLQECASSVSTNNIIPIVCDITSKEALKAAASQISSEVGFINLLCCNAGIAGPLSFTIPPRGATLSEFAKAQSELDIEQYVDVFRTNVAAVWFTAIMFLELLDEGNKKKNVDWSSQIVTTSSVGAFNRMTQGNYAYGQSKSAVTHMTKQLATQLVPYGIRANCIAPGRM
jgi:NAD(P)-dependent dehydrogenase (short-subunit alcohol dehydrogenase family)